jgi:hypothetical protein
MGTTVLFFAFIIQFPGLNKAGLIINSLCFAAAVAPLMKYRANEFDSLVG